MSDYDAASELNRLAAQSPTKTPVEVSEDLFRVLRRSEEISKASEGAFDITVGPLTKLWRRARRQKELPPADLFAAAREAVGWKSVRLGESRRVELLLPGMRLDLGGIAKGDAADQALAMLRRRGFSRATVNASGNIAIGEPPPGESGWKIAMLPNEAPGKNEGKIDPQTKPPVARFFLLKNCGIATSGDAFQYVEIEGKRYSHILDPKTGLGLSTSASATILAPDAITADALATAACVLGPERGIALLEAFPGTSGEISITTSGELKTARTPRWNEIPTTD